MTRLPRFALLALILAPACKGDDESAAVEDYVDGVDGYTRNICACEYDNPLVLLPLFKVAYASSEECLMDLPPNAAERGCIDGLFQDQSVDYAAVLDCRAAALGRSSACLQGKTCTDTARGDCYADLADEVQSCPDLPEDVETKLNDCLYN